MYIEIKTALSISFFQNMNLAYKKDYIILSILSIFLHKSVNVGCDDVRFREQCHHKKYDVQHNKADTVRT